MQVNEWAKAAKKFVRNEAKAKSVQSPMTTKETRKVQKA